MRKNPRFSSARAAEVDLARICAPVAAFAAQPLVIAFAPRAHLRSLEPSAMHSISAELRGLGAALVVHSDVASFCLRPDDACQISTAQPRFAAAALAELCRAAGAPGARFGAGFSLFVVDRRSRLRFARIDASCTEEPMQVLLQVLSESGRQLSSPSAARYEMTRRALIVSSLASACAVALAEACNRVESPRAPAPAAAPQPPPPTAAAMPEQLEIHLKINGQDRALRAEPRVSLLDALRERLGLTGTKKGCDHGQCGACTVLMDGRRVNACLTLAVMAQGTSITTIEGLAKGDELHPMQSAFVLHDALQCGYCTPGQILSAVSLVREGRAHSDEEIREAMSGNICRCGAYNNIVRAISEVQKGGA
jgi:xanthine dehydrogenase YagT iron-sulfur-binding subunit